MSLTAEEEALFADIDSTPVTTAPAAEVDDLEAERADEEARHSAALKTSAPAAPAAPAAPKARRMNMIDVAAPAASSPAPEPVASTPPVEAAVTCECGEAITVENGSRLQDGKWKHIGCKLNAPPPATKAPKKAKSAPPPAATTTATPPPAPKPSPKPFAGETQTDRDAREAMEAMQAAPTAPVNVKPPPPVPDEDLRGVGPAVLASIPPNPEPIGIAREANARIALAETFEGIAKLLRSVA